MQDNITGFVMNPNDFVMMMQHPKVKPLLNKIETYIKESVNKYACERCGKHLKLGLSNLRSVAPSKNGTDFKQITLECPCGYLITIDRLSPDEHIRIRKEYPLQTFMKFHPGGCKEMTTIEDVESFLKNVTCACSLESKWEIMKPIELPINVNVTDKNYFMAKCLNCKVELKFIGRVCKHEELMESYMRE